jgi:hypothetical protein
MAEIRSFNKKQVRLIGTYHSAALYQGPKRKDVDPVQAVIRLDDGEDVLVEPNWSPASRRDQSERDQFDHRRVAVEGSIHMRCPESPEPQASIVGPCIRSVRSIRLLSEEGDS